MLNLLIIRFKVLKSLSQKKRRNIAKEITQDKEPGDYAGFKLTVFEPLVISVAGNGLGEARLNDRQQRRS